MGQFINFNHDGSITRDEADGSKTVLDPGVADQVLGGVADWYRSYVERNKDKPFKPVAYRLVSTDDGIITYEVVKESETLP